MNRRSMLHVGITAAVLVAITAVSAWAGHIDAGPVPSYTGCLSRDEGGRIYNVQFGNGPANCHGGDSQVHLSGGDITSINAGTGLSGTASEGAANLAVDFSDFGTCPAGSAIRVAGTTATCEPDDVGGGLQGIKAFTADGTFVVPSGVRALLVEAWGGAGGGGGGHPGIASGGGGGAGGFVKAVVAVEPGVTLVVDIGAGGAGGSSGSGPSLTPGGNGEDTTLTGPGVGVTAEGGDGGGVSGPIPAPGGAGGGGSPTDVMIPGEAGGPGTFSAQGPGGQPAFGTRPRLVGVGGTGGNQLTDTPGGNGGPGFMIIQW